MTLPPPVRQLLIIKSPQQESVVNIVGRMEVLLDYFKQQPRHTGLVPFLQIYALVTKAVVQGSLGKANYFHNPAAVETLDVYFASLYFQPLLKFLDGQTKLPTPWRTYYSYCRSGRQNAFVELLLGINAHINGDLPICLAHLRYQELDDFKKINRILSELVPAVMYFLTVHYHNTLALGGLVLPQFTHEEFYRLIVQWRAQAWHNAALITPVQYQHQKRSIHKQTEAAGEQIIKLFRSPEHFLLHRSDLHSLKIDI